MAEDWKIRFVQYIRNNKPKDSALSSTEEDSLQDDCQEKPTQDNGGYPE